MMKAMEVLRQAPIAHLVEAEDSLHDIERVLDADANLRLLMIVRLLLVTQQPMDRALFAGQVLGARRLGSNRLALSGVGLVAPHLRLLSMKEAPRHTRALHVRRACHHRVNSFEHESTPMVATSLRSSRAGALPDLSPAD
jgi:hypothetical protein